MNANFDCFNPEEETLRQEKAKSLSANRQSTPYPKGRAEVSVGRQRKDVGLALFLACVMGAGAATWVLHLDVCPQRARERGVGLITPYTPTNEKRTRYRCAKEAYRLEAN